MMEEDEEGQTQAQKCSEQKTDIESAPVSENLMKDECPTKQKDIEMSQAIKESDITSVAEAQNMLNQECPSPPGNIEIVQLEEKVPTLGDNQDAAVTEAEVPLPESDEESGNILTPHGQSGPAPAPVTTCATILKSAPTPAPTTTTSPAKATPKAKVPTKKIVPMSRNVPSPPAQAAKSYVQENFPTWPNLNQEEMAKYLDELYRLQKESERAGWETVERKPQRTKDIQAAASALTSMLEPSQVKVTTSVSDDTPALTKSQKKNKKRREKERMAKQEQAREQQEEQGQSMEQEASSTFPTT